MVEADVHFLNGSFHRAVVPSGASTGIYEALELHDGGKDFLGKGHKSSNQHTHFSWSM